MTLDPSRLQALLDESATQFGIVGAQLAVFDGTDQVEVATGLADAPRGTPVTTDTVFQVGSTTKVFNATLVHQLVDDGRLELDTPVVEVLPGFRVAPLTATAAITVRDLISMRSGMDNGPYTDFGPGDDAVARYTAALAEVPILAEPRQVFGYSNASTVVAGRVVEQVTGLTWEQALRTRVLARAGLQSSAAAIEDLPYHPVAVGHSVATADAPPTPTRPWSIPRSLAPAGSTLCATAGDLVRFARVMLRSGKAEDGTVVLTEASTQELQTPQIDCPPILLADKWAAGAFWRQWDGEVVVGHSGTNSSGSSTLLWLPGVNGAIAVVANVPRLQYPLALAIFNEVFPDVFGVKVPAPPTPDPSIAVDADALVGRYTICAGEHQVSRADDGSLALTTRSSAGLFPPITVKLLPIGPLSFLPDDAAVSGNRGYALAFALGEDGRASHFLHGPFLSRRAAD